MNDHPTPPEFPAGELNAEAHPSAEHRADAIRRVEALPGELHGLVAHLSDAQLGTRYVKWTVRQIANHLADSHINAVMRFKWALTEEDATIKPSKRWEWSQLPDADTGPHDAIGLLVALHRRWSVLLRGMSDSDFRRTYRQPESGRVYTLGEALVVYAWHGEHHAAQIRWLSEYYGWSGRRDGGAAEPIYGQGCQGPDVERG